MAQCGDVSSGPFNSGDGYVIDFQYASEDQVFVYYNSNRDKVYIPQDDPTYPWTFEHATRILFTAGDPPFPIWIERITAVNPLPAYYQAGNAIRAVDLNNNFQVMADAVEEAQSAVACVDDILDDVINNIQTNLQYIALPDVEALNAEAVKNPDSLSGYDVLDSTGIDSLASPIVNNLPPTAGGDPGEDPVNGVYWNDGIVTRVYWDKNNQRWEFVFYFSGNADNRYQQQTIADPITPNPNDYKDGTLWFDTGDGNLYVLFNDGDSRQWVITNPLSSYGEVATTADIHWSRNAADNTVYPRNSTDSIITNGGNVSLTADGNGTFTGKITTASTVDSDDDVTVTTKDYVDTALSTLGEGFVEVAGDNMTGNLTLGTGKITLDATDGTADFTGTIDVGSYTAFGTGSGFRLSSGGQLNINRAANNTAIQIAEVGDATPTVLIQSNGSSTFRGSLRNGAEDTNVAVIGETGIYQSYRSDATSKACFQTFVATDPNTPTSQIFSDGSAEFEGTVDVTAGGYIFIGRRSSDDTAMFAVNASGLVNIGAISGADSNIVLKGSDGSAKFVGDVIRGDYAANFNYAALRDGQIEIGKDTTSGSSSLLSGTRYNGGTATSAFIFQADGSATFTGTVTAPEFVPPSDARFKENITPAKSQLADVVALGGILKNYDWNDKAPLNEEIRSVRQLGLIAQEVAEICPSIVKDIHRTKTVEVKPAVVGPLGKVREESITQEIDDSYKGISQEALVMKLIGAVSELTTKVETLEAYITTQDI